MGNFVEGLRQIAVVTKNGAVGEILSTALFAAGPEQRETLLASLRPLLGQSLPDWLLIDRIISSFWR